MDSAARAPETRSEGAIDALRDAILTGRLVPGQRLLQEELAAEYGVSRIPLREALRRLEGEGLVVISPNRGATVRPLTAQDVVDVFDLRLALESLALRRAAARPTDVREATERRRTAARVAMAAGDLPTLFRLDRDFHADLAAASHNEHLIGVLDGQWSQIMRMMHAYLRHATYPRRVWDEHREIAEAVARGDGAAAVALLERHLSAACAQILADLRSASPLP